VQKDLPTEWFESLDMTDEIEQPGPLRGAFRKAASDLVRVGGHASWLTHDGRSLVTEMKAV
jgi:hypothetical protein